MVLSSLSALRCSPSTLSHHFIFPSINIISDNLAHIGHWTCGFCSSQKIIDSCIILTIFAKVGWSFIIGSCRIQNFWHSLERKNAPKLLQILHITHISRSDLRLLWHLEFQYCASWNQTGHYCFASYEGRPSPGCREQRSGMLFPIYSVFAQSCCCCLSTEHLLEHSAEKSTRLARTILTCLNGKYTSWGGILSSHRKWNARPDGPRPKRKMFWSFRGCFDFGALNRPII